MITPRQLKDAYDEGQDVSALLRQESGIGHNAEVITEISYDLQAGSYVNLMSDPGMVKHIEGYTAELAARIGALCQPKSILEAGVGEGLVLSGVAGHLGPANVDLYGFDLSWSAVRIARKWLHNNDIDGATLCTGSLQHIPFADDSVDVVFTSHSIESNRGKEELILRELYRVTRDYLILLEPGYELASDEAKKRMDSHGYCKGLPEIYANLGYQVVTHEVFPFISNPRNPTAITVIKKGTDTGRPSYVLACPKYKTRLLESGYKTAS